MARRGRVGYPNPLPPSREAYPFWGIFVGVMQCRFSGTLGTMRPAKKSCTAAHYASCRSVSRRWYCRLNYVKHNQLRY